MKPKITMNKVEKITVTEHPLEEYDCLLIYDEKRDNKDTPVLFAIMELMTDLSCNDEQIYILVNYVNGSKRGIYPCEYCNNSWEDVVKEYFVDPNEFSYSYKRENDDYTVNEEYNFK